MIKDNKNLEICKKMKKEHPIWTFTEETKNSYKIKIHDFKFVTCYKKTANIEFIGDGFYDLDGAVSKQSIEQNIQNIIQNYAKDNLDSKVNSLFNSLVKHCHSIRKDNLIAIHTLSNKLKLKESGIEVHDKEISATRLNVNYNENAGEPTQFLKFLNELLEEKDITIIQEYWGYGLFRENRAQKGLFLTGKGGEGKSLLGKIYCDILGEETILGGESLVDMLSNQFGLGNLINKLIIYDDDISDLELKDSATFKKLISGGYVSSQKKYKDPITVESCCKIFGCGNHIPRAKAKDTKAFKRRLLIIETKEKNENRIDDTNLLNKLLKEKEAIFLWILEGFYRLAKNKFHFSYEDEMENKVEKLISQNSESHLVSQFLNDTNYIRLNTDKKELSRSLYQVYNLWALDNNKKLLDYNIFTTILGNISSNYNLKDTFIQFASNKKLRGWQNIEIVRRDFSID